MTSGTLCNISTLEFLTEVVVMIDSIRFDYGLGVCAGPPAVQWAFYNKIWTIRIGLSLITIKTHFISFLI